MIEDCTTNKTIDDYIKPCLYNPVGLYYSEVSNSNVYIGEDSERNKCFMIKVDYNRLTVQLIETAIKLSELNCASLINFISLSKVNEEYYLVYDYCSGIQLSDYVTKALPNSKRRMAFLSKFIEALQLLNKNQICLSDEEALIDYYVFVESYSNSNIKILLANGVITHSNSNSKKPNEDGIENENANNVSIKHREYKQLDYFKHLAHFIYTISKSNNNTPSSSNEDNYKFLNEYSEDAKEKIKSIFDKVFNYCKEGGVSNDTITSNSNSISYSFEMCCMDFKALYDELESSKPNNNTNNSANNSNNKIVAAKKLFAATEVQAPMTTGTVLTTTSTNKKPLTKMPSFTTQSSNNVGNVNSKDSQEMNTNKKNIKVEAKSNYNKQISTNKPNDNVIKIAYKDDKSDKDRVMSAGDVNMNKHNEVYNNNNINKGNGTAFMAENSNTVNNNNINMFSFPNNGNSNLNPNSALPFNPLLVSPFQNYNYWLSQSLNRIGFLDQMLMTQMIDIKTLWQDIQLSHYYFLNQIQNNASSNSSLNTNPNQNPNLNNANQTNTNVNQ